VCVLHKYHSVKRVIGQSDLIGVIILIGAVLVIGVTFASVTLTNVLSFTSINQVKTILMEDQSTLVLYVERENQTHVCLGLLRTLPDYRLYGFGLLSEDLKQDLSSAIITPIPGVFRLESTDSNRVYRLYQGEYYSIPIKGRINVYLLTDQGVREYILKQKPLLICIDKTILETNGYFMVFSFVNNELYEVRGWYVTSQKA